MPIYFYDDSRFGPWVELWIRIILREVPEAAQPADRDARARWPWWRAKRLAIEVWHRLFAKLANQKFDPATGKNIGAHFEATYAGPILVAIFQLLNHFRQGSFLTEKVLSVSLHYMNVAYVFHFGTFVCFREI